MSEELYAEDALKIFERVARGHQHQAAPIAPRDDEPLEATYEGALATFAKAARSMAASTIKPTAAAPAARQQARPQASTGKADPILVLMERTGAAPEMEPVFRAEVARRTQEFTGWQGLPKGQTPLSWALTMTQSDYMRGRAKA